MCHFFPFYTFADKGCLETKEELFTLNEIMKVPQSQNIKHCLEDDRSRRSRLIFYTAKFHKLDNALVWSQ